MGSYQFTTLEPHLGALYEFTIADIPGIIEGASEGKGLGHIFLRHIARTKMLLHLISLENEDPVVSYYTIRNELSKYETKLENETGVKSRKHLIDPNFLSEADYNVIVVMRLKPTKNTLMESIQLQNEIT